MLATLRLRKLMKLIQARYSSTYGWDYERNQKEYDIGDPLGDATPMERGYRLPAHREVKNKGFNQIQRPEWIPESNTNGLDNLTVVDASLNDSPLGDFQKFYNHKSFAEIRTRMQHVLKNFKQFDLRNFDWDKPFYSVEGLDSLDRIAIITSIESEFSTVFEDNVFDNFKTPKEIVVFLSRQNVLS